MILIVDSFQALWQKLHTQSQLSKSRTDKCTWLQNYAQLYRLQKPNNPTHANPTDVKEFLEQGKTTYELLKDPQRQMPDIELQMLKKNEHSDVILCESAISVNNDFVKK